MKTNYKIALAKAAYTGVKSARALVGLGNSARVMRRGLNYDLNLSEGIDFAIFLLGAFEPGTYATLDRLIKPGFVVLDIGANIGAHTLHMAQAVGAQGRVLAFEPTDHIYQKLVRNIELNPDLALRIKTFRAFLASQDDAAKPERIFSSWPLTGGKELHPEHLGASNTTDGAIAIRLDTILQQENIPRIDLVKMDVDGFECCVLGGCRETMKRDKPVFLFELAPYVLEEQNASVEQLLEFFVPLGYRFTDADTGKELAVSELTGWNAQGASRNVVARCS